LRDFRNTNDTAMLGPYVQALTAFSPRIQWASPRQAPSSIPSAGRPDYLPGANSSVTAAPGIVFQTARFQDFSVPTLFGISAADRLQAAVVTAATFGAVALGAATIFGRAGAAA
jgi:hypothetical protein